MPSGRVFSGKKVDIGTVSTLLGTVTISGTVTGLPSGTQTIAGSVSLSGTGNVTIASITTGTVSISPMYINAQTAIGATGAGILCIGVQWGATTTARALTLNTTGAVLVQVINNLSAALLTGTTRAGSLFSTAHPTSWDATVIATTSAAAGVIVKTSGAYTLYITDLLVNVDGPMTVTLCSETTPKMYLVGLATKGGFAMNNVTPIVLASAESLRVVLGSSGSCSVFAAGYTVT